jgi:hypothetical protein
MNTWFHLSLPLYYFFLAMIERYYCLKKNCKNKMNNILNQIGIENYIPERNTFFFGMFKAIQTKCHYRIYVN